ncbi:MAG: type II toxin-antitoxin system VapC family toxin [Thermodesulfobacteriota bacterium]
MRLLLDTHAFIWWDSEPARLPHAARAACEDLNNCLLFSVAGVWEMQIKLQLGKLQLIVPLGEIIGTQQESNNLQVLPVGLEHVLALEDLPSYHKDPFDRLIIAQARVEDAVVVTNDAVFSRYPVQVLW